MNVLISWQVGVPVPLATLLPEKRRIHSSTAWKPPQCKAWSRAFRARRWPASSKSFPFTLHQSRCLCRRGRMVRQCSTPTFGSLKLSLCFSICVGKGMGGVDISSFLDLLSPPHVPHLPKIVTRRWEDWPYTDHVQLWLFRLSYILYSNLDSFDQRDLHLFIIHLN